MSLPGVCRSCRTPVVWRDGHWWEASAHHHCDVQTMTVCVVREVCDTWMPNAKEWCARKRGHGTEHRTRYAMSNAMRPRRWVA